MLLDTLGAGKLPLAIVSGEGALLWDADGRTWWDFYGGHAVTLLGQGHPRWADAIAQQARTLSFVTTVVDTPVRDRAAARLCAFTGMDQVFFVNSGAEANEAALKLARKATGRPVIIAMEEGFHGRSMGAVGVTHHYRTQHAPAHGDVRFVPFGDLEALERALDGSVAAVICEPVQGMAGVVVPPRGWLAGVKAACERNGSLLIADEVQCGLGRMGVPLASMLDGVRPDIVSVGKGLGNGFPVAACLMTDAVAATARPGEHGTTFGGGPLAAAAVEATLAIVEDEDLLARGNALGQEMAAVLGRIPGVLEVRGSGPWLGVVLDRPAKIVAAGLRDQGFLVGTSSDPYVLRLAPPAVTPVFAVRLLGEALSDVLGGAMRAAGAA
ncbi:MAG: aspartate aminotransferase family protein [Myxococcales bacterium]|nr:aspartate aminotransferase family protein [Myxococcales bacterium]MCB9670626.1 aspartate aminotransferase family protein [Alphaproteobacteria bacterium]